MSRLVCLSLATRKPSAGQRRVGSVPNQVIPSSILNGSYVHTCD